MYYQKPETIVLIGNAMIPDCFVAMGYTGTLCFSVCKINPADNDPKRIFFDVSVTLSQLQQLNQAITQYLKLQSEYPLPADRFGDHE